MQRHDWVVAMVLSVVAGCAVLCPLADAAVSRRSEYAADRFAAEQGVGAVQVATFHLVRVILVLVSLPVVISLLLKPNS